MRPRCAESQSRRVTKTSSPCRSAANPRSTLTRMLGVDECKARRETKWDVEEGEGGRRCGQGAISADKRGTPPMRCPMSDALDGKGYLGPDCVCFLSGSVPRFLASWKVEGVTVVEPNLGTSPPDFSICLSPVAKGNRVIHRLRRVDYIVVITRVARKIDIASNRS